MGLNFKDGKKATLDYLVKDFYETIDHAKNGFCKTLDDAKNIKNYFTNHAAKIALYTVLGALTLNAATGCIWNKKDNSGSSTPVVNYVIQAKDFAGNPVQGAQLSLYDASVYNTDDGTGDLDALVAKASGYYTSDANGEFKLNLSDGKYHAVIKSTGNETEKEFNLIVPGPPPNSPNKTVEVLSGNDGNFNAEGHIKYKENYADNNNNPDNPPNRYTVGDKVKFQVFGNNKSELEQIISFCVLDHTTTGNPNEAPVVYRGSFAVESERLAVPAGEKTYKVFEWTIPANLKDKIGKYAIHVTWTGYDEEPDGTPDPWHKIGNLFLVDDNTPLVVDAGAGGPFFTNEDVTAWVTISDPAESGSVRAQEVDIASGSGGTYYIDRDREVDTPYDPNIPGSGDGDPANDFDITSSSFPAVIPAYGEVLAPAGDIGKNATRKKIRVWAVDIAGNRSYSDGEFDLHITKPEADLLADPIYDNFKIGAIDDYFNYFTDFNKTTTVTAIPFDVLCNKFNNSYKVGHNYKRQGGLTDEQKAMLEVVINDNSGPEFIKAIERDTKVNFITALTNYLQLLKDRGRVPP